MDLTTSSDFYASSWTGVFKPVSESLTDSSVVSVKFDVLPPMPIDPANDLSFGGASSAAKVYRDGTSATKLDPVKVDPAIFEECYSKFLNAAQYDDVEYGYLSKTDLLIEMLSEKYPAEIGGVLQSILMKVIDKPKLIVLLLKAVSELKFQALYPYAPLMAMSVFAIKNPEVVEAGIRAYEKWGDPEGIVVLKEMKMSQPWLEAYRLDTIAFLESL